MRVRSIVVVATVAATACSGVGADSESVTSATRPVAESTTATSTSTSTSTSTTTTLTPTTTTTPLPVPAPAPPEDGSTEPRVELGSIEIPRIDLEQTMFEGIRLSTLDLGPGHWPGTALPGELGNVVVGGHRTSHGKPFRHLDRLEPGDEVIFTDDSGRFVYRVTGTEVVTPDAIHIIEQTHAYTATLFACEPPHSTKFRLVVHLELSNPVTPAT